MVAVGSGSWDRALSGNYRTKSRIYRTCSSHTYCRIYRTFSRDSRARRWIEGHSVGVQDRMWGLQGSKWDLQGQNVGSG